MTDQAPAYSLESLAGGPAAEACGIELIEARPGHAWLRMVVADFMLNAYGLCHGGYAFLFADTAFGAAANAHGPVALATHAEIVFTRPAPAGVTLLARADELVRFGRNDSSAIYDVQVTDEAGAVYAQFRGTIKVPAAPPAD